MFPEPGRIEVLMERALAQAERAFAAGEVPVGAVIFDGEQIIAEAHNRTEILQDPSAHAELLAIRQACGVRNNWRLPRCTLVVTLEPCLMCAGAILQSRIPTVVFGASDSRMGAFGSQLDCRQCTAHGDPPQLIDGIFAERSRQLLRTFFQERRADKVEAD